MRIDPGIISFFGKNVKHDGKTVVEHCFVWVFSHFNFSLYLKNSSTITFAPSSRASGPGTRASGPGCLQVESETSVCTDLEPICYSGLDSE